MRMIRPRLATAQITIAEEQEQFKPVTAALVRHPQYPGVMTERGEFNSVVLAFRPDAEQRARLAAGEAIYVSLLTFMQPMQGIILSVGPEEPAAWYNVPVEVSRA